MRRQQSLQQVPPSRNSMSRAISAFSVFQCRDDNVKGCIVADRDISFRCNTKSIVERGGEAVGGGRGRTHLLLAFSHLAVDHASLS